MIFHGVARVADFLHTAPLIFFPLGACNCFLTVDLLGSITGTSVSFITLPGRDTEWLVQLSFLVSQLYFNEVSLY